MRRAPLIAGLIAALALGLAPAGAGAAPGGSAVRAAAVVDCRAWVWYPNVKVSSARNMRCRAARRELRRYRAPIYRRFKTPGGFRCRRVAGMALSGQWRCVRGTRAFRFEFGD